MTRYIVLYHAPHSVAERFARATPEEAQAGVAAWQDWADRLGPRLVDIGRPLGRNTTVTAAGPGPDSDVIGMSLLDAASLDEAVDLVRDHHHLAWDAGCSITVLEEAAIPELA